MDTTILVILDEQDELISISQVGLANARSQEVLLECISAAKKRRSVLKHIYKG